MSTKITKGTEVAGNLIVAVIHLMSNYHCIFVLCVGKQYSVTYHHIYTRRI